MPHRISGYVADLDNSCGALRPRSPAMRSGG